MNFWNYELCSDIACRSPCKTTKRAKTSIWFVTQLLLKQSAFQEKVQRQKPKRGNCSYDVTRDWRRFLSSRSNLCWLGRKRPGELVQESPQWVHVFKIHVWGMDGETNKQAQIQKSRTYPKESLIKA